MILSDKPLIKNDKIAIQERAQETYILALRDTTLHYLGEIETYLWKAIDGKRTVDDLVRLTCEEYDVEQTEADKDVRGFIASLKESDLISQEE